MARKIDVKRRKLVKKRAKKVAELATAALPGDPYTPGRLPKRKKKPKRPEKKK